jgi:hypothetical protein
MKKKIIILSVLFFLFWLGAAAQAAIIVGRIGYVEGEIYRYLDSGNDWVETYVDSPTGIGDTLATNSGSRAEINIPNKQVLRLAENTEIEVINLEEDSGEFYLQAGLARFYNNGKNGTIRIATERGDVRVPAGSVVDLQAEKTQLKILAVSGGVTFHARGDVSRKESIEVIDQGTNLTFYDKTVIAGIGPFDRTWDRWCAEREGVWQERRYVRSAYLPEPLQVHAYVLKPHGRWQRVYFRGYYYWAWKPLHVAVGWAPYTTGYWHDWSGERVWIDRHPWGWVTHHHGHWVHVHGTWMWTPYVHVAHTPGITVTGFSVSFGRTYRPHWHPGRVRWLANGDNVGWLPLAPWEQYYGYRKWGPRSVATLNKSGVSLSINIDLSSHRYVDHSVVVPKHYFHRKGPVFVKNYNTVKIKNINRTKIVKNYSQVPVVEERKRLETANAGTYRDKTRKKTQVISKRKVEQKKIVSRKKKFDNKDSRINHLSQTRPLKRSRSIGEKKRQESSKRIAREKTVREQKRVVVVNKNDSKTDKVVRQTELHEERIEKRQKYLDREKPANLKKSNASRESRRNGKLVSLNKKKSRRMPERETKARVTENIKRKKERTAAADKPQKNKGKKYARQQGQQKNRESKFSQREDRGQGDRENLSRRKRYSVSRSASPFSSFSDSRGRL